MKFMVYWFRGEDTYPSKIAATDIQDCCNMCREFIASHELIEVVPIFSEKGRALIKASVFDGFEVCAMVEEDGNNNTQQAKVINLRKGK